MIFGKDGQIRVRIFRFTTIIRLSFSLTVFTHLPHSKTLTFVKGNEMTSKSDGDHYHLLVWVLKIYAS